MAGRGKVGWSKISSKVKFDGEKQAGGTAGFYSSPTTSKKTIFCKIKLLHSTSEGHIQGVWGGIF